MNIRKLAAFLVVLCPLAVLVAQTVSSQISGTVFDSSGAVVPKARVTVRNTGTGVTRTGVTNDSGYYVFTDLQPGLYEFSAEMEGFKRFVQSDITLNANAKVTINGTLSPGVPSEVVEVSAKTNQVETASGEVGAVISNRQVTELSLNGRNYVQLLQLIAGVTVDNPNAFDVPLQTAGFHVNGLRGNVNGLMVDGAYNLDIGSNSTHLVNPSIDSLQEVKVTTNSYSAEYGHAAGAQINVVTKSGTKQFHGGAFEFLRNDKLDAKDWLSNRSGLRKNPLRFNDAGGYLGGPVPVPGRWNPERSKAFFFYSGTYRHNTLGTTRTGTVPTAEERQGDFRNSSLTAPLDPVTRLPLNPANPRVLPSNLFSSNGPALLKPYPLPNTNGAGFNYVLQTIASSPQQEHVLRFDYNLSDRTQVYFRWIRDQFNWIDQASGSALGIVGETNTRNGRMYSLNIGRTFSPALVNVFNFSLSGSQILRFPQTGNFRRDTLGLTYPKLFPSNRYQAGPDVSIQGFTGYGIGVNLQNYQWLFMWRDDLTYIKGSHAMKFGVWIERFRRSANVIQPPPRDNGMVSFNRSAARSTGNPVADALLGNFQSYAESSQDSQVFIRYTEIEAYAQDNWRVRPNLSVEYGVRYAIPGAVYSALDNLIAFRPEFYDRSKTPRFNADGSLVPGVGDFIDNFYVNGLSLPGEGWPERARGRIEAASNAAFNRLFRGVPRGIYETRYNHFAPRLSFAWDPTGAGDWSIRGGAGISYDRLRAGAAVGAGLGVPFVNQVTLFDANIDQPAAGRRAAIFPSSFSTFNPVVKTPGVYSYSIGFQRRLPGSMIAEARYAATMARHILTATDLNELPLGTRLLPGNAAVPRDSLRPFPGFGTITWMITEGSSNYHALQTSLERRMQKGLRFGASYTWSKVITNALFEFGFPQNSYDLRADRGVADFDRTHVLVLNYIWELPLFQKRQDWVGKALGGWELSGISNFASGRAFTPSFSLSGDPTGTGKTSIRPDFVAPVTMLDPRTVRSFRLPNGATVSGNFFFDPTGSFALPAVGRYGNSAPGVIRGPGLHNWDISLFKNIPIKEKIKLQFRAEFFNLFNHVSFTTIGTSLPATATSSTFGQVTGVGPARVIQFGLKLSF